MGRCEGDNQAAAGTKARVAGLAASVCRDLPTSSLLLPTLFVTLHIHQRVASSVASVPAL